MKPGARQGLWTGILALLLSLLAPWPLFAHPVPKNNHDRTIRLQLLPGEEQITLRVDYRLEVDEFTVVTDDMAPFRDEIDPVKFKNQPLGYYREYMRIYAPILAKNLLGKIDGQSLVFTCVQQTPALKDEKGLDLGHLRCDFTFEAKMALSTPAGKLTFREGNFLLQEGEIRLHLDPAGPWEWTAVVAPSEELLKRPLTERKPGDDDLLREVRADFRRTDIVVPPKEVPTPAPTKTSDSHSLLRLLQQQEHGFAVLLLLAGFFGAAHALTPGHGKTLVAAYLVGQRGTVFHAMILGLVTTLTHTGAVLIFAAILHYFGLSPEMRAWLQTSLPLILGLMIVCFGFFLLLQRFAGKSDHVHIGGGHHHHHHHGPAPEVPPSQVTWASILFLGMTGGIIPCWDAIVMLVWAIGMNLLDWALPMLLAFSAGLASVLILLGILVVQLRGFAGSRFGEGKWTRRLPILSAIAIILLGFWLCQEAIHPE